MKSTYFKYLLSLIFTLSLFVTSCTNTTDPLNDSNTGSLKQVEYTPTAEQAKEQAEGLLAESFKAIIEGSRVSEGSTSLSKSNSSTYFFIDGWHTWRGNLTESPFDIQDSYNAEYLGKIQFLDGSNKVQILPEGASFMNVYLNAHSAFGFVGDDPSGDEVWYDFSGTVTPLTGNPSNLHATGEYERRWVGLYSTDGENWELTEIHNKYQVNIDGVKFYYDWNADDYRLSGNVYVTTNGFKILVRFSNSRTALVEVYQNGALIGTSQLELPNYYQMFNIPSLNDFSFGSTFTFPILTLF